MSSVIGPGTLETTLQLLKLINIFKLNLQWDEDNEIVRPNNVGEVKKLNSWSGDQ